IFDATANKKQKLITTRVGSISAMAFSPDAKLLATSGGSELRVWNTSTGDEVRQMTLENGPVSSLAFSHDAAELLAASGRIDIFDVATGKKTVEWIPIGGRPQEAAFTSQRAVVAIAGGNILTWQPEKDPKVRRIETQSALTAMALAPDGRRVLVGGRD